jgi:hypothetical protein
VPQQQQGAQAYPEDEEYEDEEYEGEDEEEEETEEVEEVEEGEEQSEPVEGWSMQTVRPQPVTVGRVVTFVGVGMLIGYVLFGR